MSTPPSGPNRRRRIAGESRPGQEATPPSRPRTVRKPVARPGSAPVGRTEPEGPTGEPTPAPGTTATPEPAPEADAGTEPEVDVSLEESTAAPADEDVTESAPRAAAPRVRRRPTPGPATETTADADTADTDPDASGSRRPALGAVLLVAVTLVALVGGLFLGYRGYTQSRSVDAAHAEAAQAAASASETIFTYRYDQLTQYAEDARDVMTASFAKDFETLSPALDELAPQRQIVVQATTRESAALPCGEDCSSDTAAVLVFVDQARLADGETVPTVFGNRVRMSMVQQDGRWLVDDIKAL